MNIINQSTGSLTSNKSIIDPPTCRSLIFLSLRYSPLFTVAVVVAALLDACQLSFNYLCRNFFCSNRNTHSTQVRFSTHLSPARVLGKFDSKQKKVFTTVNSKMKYTISRFFPASSRPAINNPPSRFPGGCYLMIIITEEYHHEYITRNNREK
jgi:hypothetical protein